MPVGEHAGRQGLSTSIKAFSFLPGGKHQLKQEAKLVFVHLKERHCLMSANAVICLWAFGRKGGQSTHPHGGNIGTLHTL